MLEVTIGYCQGGSVDSCIVCDGRALSVVPVCGWEDPGLTLRCSVDVWPIVDDFIVVPVGSVFWIAGLDVTCCVCWACCFLKLCSVVR